MMVSTKGRYGLRLMIELASRFGQGPVLVGTIAENQGISASYIHILLARLKAAGLVRAFRGPTGGYELTREPTKIAVLDIVHALEGNSWPVACVAKQEWCARSGMCAAQDVWRELAVAMQKVLSDNTLEQLVIRQNRKTKDAATFEI